jgi:hypothetical protein
MIPFQERQDPALSMINQIAKGGYHYISIREFDL